MYIFSLNIVVFFVIATVWFVLGVCINGSMPSANLLPSPLADVKYPVNHNQISLVKLQYLLMPDYLQLFALSCVSDTIFLIYFVCAATSSNRIQCYFIFLWLFLCIKFNHSARYGCQVLTVCFELYVVPFPSSCVFQFLNT